MPGPCSFSPELLAQRAEHFQHLSSPWLQSLSCYVLHDCLCKTGLQRELSVICRDGANVREAELARGSSRLNTVITPVLDDALHGIGKNIRMMKAMTVVFVTPFLLRAPNLRSC